MTQRCPFCANPDIKARTIRMNKYAWAFPTNIPIVPGHVLISPIRHVAKFQDLKPAERNAIFTMLKKIQTALRKKFGARGFNIAWNEEEVAGQSVPHFHMHVLPRKKGDAGITNYEPRKFLYRPGSREASPETELQIVAQMIRSAF